MIQDVMSICYPKNKLQKDYICDYNFRGFYRIFTILVYCFQPLNWVSFLCGFINNFDLLINLLATNVWKNVEFFFSIKFLNNFNLVSLEVWLDLFDPIFEPSKNHLIYDFKTPSSTEKCYILWIFSLKGIPNHFFFK